MYAMTTAAKKVGARGVPVQDGYFGMKDWPEVSILMLCAMLILDEDADFG